MPRYVLALPLLGLALLTLACNDDGGPATPSPTGGETPTATSGDDPSPESTAAVTPAAAETPATAETPDTDATPTPTPLPIPEGTPAVAPADLSLLENQTVEQKDCLFDPSTAVIDCGERGLYASNPIPIGADIACTLLIIEQEPIALRCSSQDPLQTIYYGVQ